jgi:antitoxin (DNA-binding transcriptional repressor) of toxin-antitoxin stability system
MTKFAALETLTMTTLPELLKTLSPGDELVLTENHQPIATLVAKASQEPAPKPRQPGNCKGLLTIVADDKEHLKDFAEYM